MKKHNRRLGTKGERLQKALIRSMIFWGDETNSEILPAMSLKGTKAATYGAEERKERGNSETVGGTL
jgi:hypothetical protein